MKTRALFTLITLFLTVHFFPQNISVIKPERVQTKLRKSEQTNITGVYKGDDGGIYYLRHDGANIYWYGEDPNYRNFSNVFKGKIVVINTDSVDPTENAFVIEGNFYDLPNARSSGSGILKVIYRNGVITKVEGPNFGGNVFRKISAGTTLTPRHTPFYSNSSYDNIWWGDDGGMYVMRAIGNKLFWFGQQLKDGRIRFANVGFGIINGNTITVEWADVPKDHTQTYRGKGTMTLVRSGNEIRKVSSTGWGFGATKWSLR